MEGLLLTGPLPSSFLVFTKHSDKKRWFSILYRWDQCSLFHCHIVLRHHNLCHEDQNLVVHLWADLEGSIDGLIE